MKGTVYINNGKWYYRVKLPGDRTRTLHKLCAPGHDTAMGADRPRELAVQAAWRIWEAHTKRPASTFVQSATVEDVCAAYCEHAKTYYRRQDGTPTSEVTSIPLSLRPLRDLYADTPVTALTHQDMIRVRDTIIGWKTCSRSTVNFYMARIRRMWAWALDEGLIGAQVKAELSQVQPMKPNRTALREPVPVLAVPDDEIERVCAISPDNFADMVRLHRLTGMRPEEVCAMKWEHIDTTATPWIYRPPFFKTQWRGMIRAVLIGPKARAILSKYRDADFDGFPFCPARVIASGTKLANGRNKRRPLVEVAASVPTKRGISCWNTETYTSALRTYCRQANIKPYWTANRLRHSFATQVRREFGIVKAGFLLGHSHGSRITDGYSREAAVDEIVREAGDVIERIG